MKPTTRLPRFRVVAVPGRGRREPFAWAVYDVKTRGSQPAASEADAREKCALMNGLAELYRAVMGR